VLRTLMRPDLWKRYPSTPGGSDDAVPLSLDAFPQVVRPEGLEPPAF